MTPHDPLCPFVPPTVHQRLVPCQCALIAKARADERERFADIPDTFRMLAVATEHEVTRAAYLFGADLVATRIARQGGPE